ncbi:hypothetical protein OOZ19_20005 [Saccharopolyspora sp. NFXS83]|uniref:hypothetical protein n=1 Tax=Saccharopolyspora sp. NFXS83 TaxID=2993560 RepID=UPI00224B33EC|nr:hypothetical protein [Saccharopolyspora sp. NFXS83]MCX2732529.1 hypothetical protein [Saccharopolyspora sp. NFXS83]
MSEKRPGLILHLAGVSQPLHIALDATEAETLDGRLAELMGSGGTTLLTTADGGKFAVNFAHVATAHVESTRSDSNAYGAPNRTTGFAS